MSDRTSVLIVDDERLFAELMRLALSAAPGIDVLDVVHDVATAIRRARELHPALVLSDYHLPDGTGADVARALRGTETAVLILTGDGTAAILSDVARSGAVGHMTKGKQFEEVVHNVRAAAAGEVLFAPSELQRLLLADEPGRQLTEPLTARELDVLRLLAAGLSTSAAAGELHISTATLRAHVQAILRKLSAHSRLEAVAEAARLGLVTLDAWTRKAPSGAQSGELARAR
jgi:DNA-binding NarL/FixJ family response regulator